MTQDNTVAGTPGLAARIERTLRGTASHLTPNDKATLRGSTAPMPAWRLVAAAGDIAPPKLTPFGGCRLSARKAVALGTESGERSGKHGMAGTAYAALLSGSGRRRLWARCGGAEVDYCQAS